MSRTAIVQAHLAQLSVRRITLPIASYFHRPASVCTLHACRHVAFENLRARRALLLSLLFTIIEPQLFTPIVFDVGTIAEGSAVACACVCSCSLCGRVAVWPCGRVRLCACACICACARVCVRVCARACVPACVRACLRQLHARFFACMQLRDVDSSVTT